MRWTVDQVLALAPDDGSAKAGQGLARAAKWKELGRSEAALWGAVQGSGKEPYRVRIDLAEPAFKCSCPSRKFPCKHGLGLFLILAENAGAIPAAAPPEWVADWLAERGKRQDAKTAQATEARAVDEHAQAKRAAKRTARVEEGVEELSLWMRDLVRQGLGNAQQQPLSYWESTAARLIDAQAPGLARSVRRLGEVVSSGAGWQERLLAGLGRLHLLCEACRRIADLPEDVQADVRIAIGWTVPKEELLHLPRQTDTWCVLAQRVDREEQLRVQRTWLLGLESGRSALILHFAAGSQGFEQSFRVGAQFASELIYFPGSVPLRALLVGERCESPRPDRPLPKAPSLLEAAREYAKALARQPWLEAWPMRVGGLFPAVDHESGNLLLCDDHGRPLPVVDRFAGGWHLAAISGGAAIEVFGEWDGDALRPLSATANSRLFTFSQTDTATMLARVA